MKQSKPPEVTSLAKLMSNESLHLLEASGPELLRRIGMDAVMFYQAGTCGIQLRS
jgi:hypothetical protein